MSGFYQALEFTLGVEGGFSDDPADRGGATNYGVTQKVYDDWRRRNGETPRSVKKIDPPEVQGIYHQNYWIPGKCEAMPWPVSRAHFDACVNHGPGNAARILQRALMVPADGAIGPKTLAALNDADTPALLSAMLWQRLRFYRDIVTKDASQRKFLLGWLNRILKMEAG